MERNTYEKSDDRKQILKFSLIILILTTGILLFRQAMPYMNGILGALTLFILLRRPTYRLAEKMKPALAVTLMTVIVTLFIIIPVSLFVWYIVSNLQAVNWNPQALVAPVTEYAELIREKTGFDLFSTKSLTYIASGITGIGQAVMSGIGNFAVNMLVAVMLLYFLLQGGRKFEDYIISLLPFSDENKHDVIDRIKKMVRSNAIGIPLLAIIQGLIAWLGYVFIGVPNAFLMAFLTGLASIIPMVGTAIVWIPMAGYMFMSGNWVSGIILLAFGTIVIAQCDNLIRFILQKKMADTHPLITIFGVVAGLPIFGFMGIIFGPLIVSLFLLFLDIFRKEYLKN